MATPVSASPTAGTHAPPARSPSIAASVPNTAVSANVRSPAFAAGLRSRSTPTSSPIARLARNAASGAACASSHAVIGLPARLPRSGFARGAARAGSRFLRVLDAQLEALRTVPVVDREGVGGAQALRQGPIVTERDRVVAPAGTGELEAQVLLADQPLALDGELVGEPRRRKALAPDLAFDRARELERRVLRLERAVGLHRRRERGRVAQLAHRGVKRGGESVDVAGVQGKACGGRVPAEAEEEIGRAFRHEVERVAQMQPGH